MNTMKDFYASISSASKPQGSYLDALAKITQIKRQQTEVLMSDLAWQSWDAQATETVKR
jgi:hypothetical protein